MAASTRFMALTVRNCLESHAHSLLIFFTDAEYGLPIDEEELDRLDMNHQKYTMLMGDRLFLAPITENPQRILDLGTGTGTIHTV
jgi:hypothetical protein